MKTKTKLLCSAVTIAIGLAGLPFGAVAQAAESSISISRQDMGAALLAFSRQSGRQILFSPDAVRGKMANSVSGERDMDAALNKILRGSGLRYRTTSSGGYLIVASERVTSAAVAPAPIVANAAPQSAPEPQEAPAAEEPDIVVTGFRGSLARALDVKRQEAAAVDSILAEDIGKFPDLNLSESIQRVPGVALARDGGEGRQISVRGLGPQFTRVRINGMEAMAATGGVDSSGGTNRGRSFDFNVFASDLFNSITVRKSAEAETEEGSLGATVDLRTARPLDYNKRFTVSASAQAAYNDLAEKVVPRGSLLVAAQNDAGTFGALVSVAYARRTLVEEGPSTVRWAPGTSFAPGFESVGGTQCITANANGSSGAAVSPVPAACATANAAIHPRFPRYDSAENRIQRFGMTSSIQWKPSDDTVISLDGLYAEFSQKRNQYQLEAPSFSVAGACTAASRATNCGVADIDLLTTKIENGVMVAATANDVDLRVENRYDKLRTKFGQLTLEGSHKVGDVTFNALLGHAKSDFVSPVQTTLAYDQFNVDGYGFDFTDRNNPVYNYGNAALTTACPAGVRTNCWFLSQIRIRLPATSNTFDNGQFAVKWDVTPSIQIEGGVNYKKYNFVSTELRRTNGTAATLDTVIPAAIADSASQIAVTLNQGGHTFISPNYLTAEKTLSLRDPTVYGGAFRLGPESALGVNNSVRERDKGAFVQASLNTTAGGIGIRGNAGVRVVRTEQSATGYAIVGTAVNSITADRSYTDWLPSANLVFEPTRDLAIRVAAAKVMARPDLGSLPPGAAVTVSGASRAVSVGNPNLDPYRAKTYDASIEWYFQPGGLLSLAVFRKDIDSFVQTISSGGTFTGNPFGLPDSLAIAACGAQYPTVCNPNQNNWTFSAPTNSPGGKLQGFEVNYQQPFRFLPSFLANTGVLLNYTQVKSRIAYLNAAGGVLTRNELTGLSRRSGNATLYYEDKKFSARVSGAYRSAYLTRVPGTDPGIDVEGNGETFNLDASLQFTLTDQIKLTVEAVNLTDQYQDQYVDSRELLSVYHHTGRDFLVGVRVAF